MRYLRLLAPLALLVTIGCSYAVKIDPNIDPTANIAAKLPLKVGVFVPEEVKSFTSTDNATWAKKYTFNMGEAIESMVLKSTEKVFRESQKLDSQPTVEMMQERQLDLAVIAQVRECKVALNEKEGFFQDDASGTAHVSVGLLFYDPTMIQFTTVQGTGMGVASQGLGAFTTGKREYGTSVESAIRNLGNDLVQQMYGNYDIRKLAESKQ